MYIRFVDPKILITFADTEINFYRFKLHFPDIVTVAIQNGLRTNFGPRKNTGIMQVLKELQASEKISVDYLCLFGGALAPKYEGLVNVRTISTGGLRNNSIHSNVHGQKQEGIAYISQFPPRWHTDAAACQYYYEHPVSFATYYAAEAKIARYLAGFCRENNLKFTVCGKRDISSADEQKFYSDAVGELPWEFRPRETSSSSYELLELARIAVTTDSTMGYELLGRGLRTAFFSIRGEIISKHLETPIDDLNFGWPLELLDTGSFWTNTASEAEFSRILNYLMTVSDADWSNEIGKYTEDLMVFDPGNTVLRDLLQRLGADLTN